MAIYDEGERVQGEARELEEYILSILPEELRDEEDNELLEELRALADGKQAEINNNGGLGYTVRTINE